MVLEVLFGQNTAQITEGLSTVPGPLSAVRRHIRSLRVDLLDHCTPLLTLSHKLEEAYQRLFHVQLIIEPFWFYDEGDIYSSLAIVDLVEIPTRYLDITYKHHHMHQYRYDHEYDVAAKDALEIDGLEKLTIVGDRGKVKVHWERYYQDDLSGHKKEMMDAQPVIVDGRRERYTRKIVWI